MFSVFFYYLAKIKQHWIDDCYSIPSPFPNWHDPAWQNCPAGQLMFLRQLTHLSWYPQNLLIFWCAQCKSLAHSAHVLNRQSVFFSLLLFQILEDACLVYLSNLNKLARKSEIDEWCIKLIRNSNFIKITLFLLHHRLYNGCNLTFCSTEEIGST